MKNTGLWIDHRRAVIVILADKTEEIIQITSEIERKVRDSGASHDNSTEMRRDREDRRFDGYLSKYYAEVIAHLGDADAILIFGPGEAKSEIQKQLEKQVQGEHIVGVETTDNMTDRQITAKVRKYFLS